ncbi:MAG: hypothetical protein ACON5H_10185 [Akkermansiaceae bacterium]
MLLLFGGVFFGYQAVRSYLKSDGFRVLLGELVGDAVPGKAIFQPFQWDGWSVATDGLEVKGEGAVRLLEVDDIGASVDIGAVWDGIYRIEDVIVRKVDLKGDFRGRETVVGERIEDEVVVIDGASQLKKSFWESWLPSEVEVTSLKVTSISGEAYTDRGPWSVRGASLEVLPGDGKGAYDFTIRDGNLVSPLPLVKDLTVQVAKGRYSNGSFYLLSSSTDVFERGQLSMSGEYDLKGGEWAFSGDLVGTNLGEILPEDWKQRLFGALRVDFAARGKKKGDSVVSGDLEIKNGVLTALPILDRIAAYTNTERFRRLSLSRASLAFKQQGERLELRDIILRSEGLVQIEGDLVLEAGVIRLGRFNLGITPGTLIHLPGAETKVFQRGKLGLLWAPVNIGGTLDSPTEDLSDRLIEAAGERMFELIPETGRWALKYSGQEIGSQTKDLLENHGVVLGVANSVLGNGKSLVDEGNKALNKVIEKGTEAATDAATDAAREAVGTIFDIFGRPIPKKD